MSTITAIQNNSTQQGKEIIDDCCKTGSSNERLAIGSWSQVDSILREMAELQIAINQEIEAYKIKVKKAEDDLQNTYSVKQSHKQRLAFRQQIEGATQLLREKTELLQTRKLYWENMLRKFMTLYYERFVTTEKHFRFGSIYCRGGEVNIILNIDYAKAMLGRP